MVIIGVIAAMTVPTLITKYQKEQTVTRLKKAYSALAQTTQRAIADNGPIKTWEIGEDGSEEATVAFFTKYLKPYLNISKDCELNNTDSCKFIFKFLNSQNEQTFIGERFYLQDGTFICVHQITNLNYHKYARIYIDINGQKKPNRIGKDIFLYFYFLFDHSNDNSRTGKFIPEGYQNTRNSIVNGTCSKNGNGMECPALIMKDGWRIADDYPW